MELISNQDQLNIIESFVADLAKSLNVKEERVSFNTIWDSHPPLEAEGQTLQEYMKDVSPPSNKFKNVRLTKMKKKGVPEFLFPR